MKALEITKELGIKSVVEGRKNYVIAVSTILFHRASVGTRKTAQKKGLERCMLSDLVSGDYVILHFTYKKDVINAMEKLSTKIPTKWI